MQPWFLKKWVSFMSLDTGVIVCMIYNVILYPCLLSFGSFNNAIFRFFTYLQIINTIQKVLRKEQKRTKRWKARHRATGSKHDRRSSALAAACGIMLSAGPMCAYFPRPGLFSYLKSFFWDFLREFLGDF